MDFLQSGGIDSWRPNGLHHLIPSVGECAPSRTLHTERNRGEASGERRG
jgi:hypothetical protein